MRLKHIRGNAAAVLVPVVALVLFAGCSGDARPPANPGGSPAPSATGGGSADGGDVVPVDASGFPNPCKLVTKDEASAAVGIQFPEPTATDITDPNIGTGRGCQHLGPKRGSGAQVAVQVFANPGERYTSIRAYYESYAGRATKVSGLGDEAYTYALDPQCHIFKGKFLVVVAVYFDPNASDPADAADRRLNLYRKAAGRLPTR